MKLASEIQNGSREDLIAYLTSWGCIFHNTDPDIVLRLAAHRNFLAEGPGAGPIRASGGSNPGCHEERDHVVAPIKP